MNGGKGDLTENQNLLKDYAQIFIDWYKPIMAMVSPESWVASMADILKLKSELIFITHSSKECVKCI